MKPRLRSVYLSKFMLSPSAYPERPSGTIETSSLGCSDRVRRFPDPDQHDLYQGRVAGGPQSAIRRHEIWGLGRPKKEPVPWPTPANLELRPQQPAQPAGGPNSR